MCITYLISRYQKNKKQQGGAGLLANNFNMALLVGYLASYTSAASAGAFSDNSISFSASDLAADMQSVGSSSGFQMDQASVGSSSFGYEDAASFVNDLLEGSSLSFSME